MGCAATAPLPTPLPAPPHRPLAMAAMNSTKCLQKAGINRPLAPGMLYDCHSDKYLPNLFLWKPESITGATTRMSHVSQKVVEIVEDRFATKASCLEIDSELQLSILAGLVDVKGAAKYLTDYKSSMNLSRIGLFYKQTTKIEQLSLDKLSDQCLDRIESATHVVTEVEYGATAVFVFDSNSCKHDELLDKIKALKQHLSSSSDDVVHLTDNSDIRCTFYADIPCSKVPKKLFEVSHACQSLRVYLAEEANGVPVRVRLHPIGELNNKAHKSLSMQEVSPKLSSEIQAIFEPLHDFELRSRCISNSEVCRHIVGIKNDLKDMLQMLASYHVSVKKRLAVLIPQVRKGDAKDVALLQEDNETSPFNHTVLNSWIEEKETEVAVIEKYIESLKQAKKVKFAFQPNEIDVLSSSMNIDTIVCFDFNIIGGKDPLFAKMKSHLNGKKIIDPQYPEPQYSSASIKKMKQQVRVFLQLVTSNAKRDGVVFAVTSGCSEAAKVSGKMPCMCIYTDDNPPVSFEPPSKPGKPQASMSGDSSIQLRWEKPKQGGKFYTVLYRLANSSTDSWKNRSSAIEEATITSLLPKQEYVFKVRAETAVISGPESELSDPIAISASASLQPPAKPYATDITNSSLTLHWNKPLPHHQANIVFYTIYYRASHSKDEWITETTTDAQPKAIVTNLSSTSVYLFKVKAETGSESSPESEVSDPIETKKVMIAPPGKPCATNITHNSVSLNWTIPENRNATCRPYYIQSKFSNSVKAYTIKYRSTSDQIDSWETHTTSSNDQHCKISNLKPETNYVFQVVALTSNETSQVSKTSKEIQTKPVASRNTAIPLTSQDIDRNVLLSSPRTEPHFNYQESDPIKTKDLSPPGKPYAGDVTHDNIQIKWNKPKDGSEVVKFYKINYRSTQDKPGQWSMLSTTSPQECFTISGLQQQTAYVFQVSAVFSQSYCKDSQVSDKIQTKVLVSMPGKPIATGTTCDTIQLSWSKPAHGADLVSSYAIRRYMNNKWSPLAQGLTKECFTASNLKPGTWYHFKVLANTPTGVKESEISDSIQTKVLPLSIRLRNWYPEIVTKSGSLPMHQLKGTTTMSKKKIVMVDVGMNTKKITFQHKPHKVLMLVGATGAGKSALINGIINYIMGVKWEDDFRFLLIPEGDSQTKSQTKHITAYRFLESILPYTLTVIDTPGFGDTSGIAKDKEIRQLIKEFFSSDIGEGIDQINGIGFVTQANLPRLTVSQKYIFESVLTLFGKDIGSNVFLMATFADGHEPQVLGAVEEAQVPCQSFFKFNNSAIFAINTGDSAFDAMFWKMGMESFALFLESLSKAEPRSLTLTRQVLQERDQLEKVIQSLQPRIQTSLAKIDELKQEEDILQQQKETINSTKDYKYIVKRTEKKRVDLPKKKYTTTCRTCDYTCHEVCSKSNDSKKKYCSVMKTDFGTKDACCVICPKKCRWDEHFNTPFKWELYQVEETRTIDDLKARYETAVSGKMKEEAIIARLREEIEKCQNETLSVINEVKSCLERLNEIALRPNPITEVEYIDILIESKKQEKKLGWKEEVRALMKLRETAELQHKLMFKDPEAMERKITMKRKQ